MRKTEATTACSTVAPGCIASVILAVGLSLTAITQRLEKNLACSFFLHLKIGSLPVDEPELSAG